MRSIKKQYLRGLVFLLVWPGISYAQQKEQELLHTTTQWFTAWELLSKDIYGLKQFYPVDLVFFDSLYVYSNSTVSVASGTAVKAHPLMNRHTAWKKASHNGMLVLPDSTKVPVGLMSFAGDNTITGKPFFVMPLPSFWKTAGITSTELGLENLITGVFLHEFSHSQQMQNFGKKIAGLERTSNYGVAFTDDIVQDLFKTDSSYVQAFRSETNGLYEAAMETNAVKRKALMQQALTAISVRQQLFFRDSLKALEMTDHFFLTMEGLGQYSMYAWLKHPRGANLPEKEVIKGVRRGKKQWSQDQGFALFLLLEKYEAPASWAPGLFADQTTPVLNLLLPYAHVNK